MDPLIDSNLNEILAKVRQEEYYDHMEIATSKEVVDLAVLVQVLVLQLNAMLLKYPSFNHQVSAGLEYGNKQTNKRVKNKTYETLLLPSNQSLKLPRKRSITS